MSTEDTKPSAFDSQVGGDHYKKFGAYQPWEVLAKWMTAEELKGFMKGTVIAYLAREQDKNGLEDIKKAGHTIQLYLELQAKAAEAEVKEAPEAEALDITGLSGYITGTGGIQPCTSKSEKSE